MSTLLVWREKLQRLYANYSIYFNKGLQLILGLLVFGLINYNVGFMETAASIFFTVGLAVICTFFPLTVMVIAATILLLVHFYTLSLSVAIVALVIFLAMYIFYFRFGTGKAWLVLVAALAFGLRIPFVLPVVFGLMGTAVWIVPAACGIVSYYMISCVKASATALSSSDSDMISGLTAFAKQVLTNQEMWIMIMIAALGILVVHLISTLAVSHAWKIASAAGAAVCVIAVSAGNIALNLHISYVITILSAVLGVAAGIVLEFLFFSVDYSGTEHIQFEDDEYYYYVTAVPKVDVSIPEKQVKHITGHQTEEQVAEREKEGSGSSETGSPAEEKASDFAMTSDIDIAKNTEEILLTRSLSKELGLDDNKNPHE